MTPFRRAVFAVAALLFAVGVWAVRRPRFIRGVLAVAALGCAIAALS